MKVFLSAVTNELGSFRKELAHTLRRKKLQVRVQEDFRPGTATLLEFLRDYIKECDLVILLIGERSGAFPTQKEVTAIGCIPGLDQYRRGAKQSCASYTQWEFFFAQEYKKKVLVFLSGKEFVPDKPNAEFPEDQASQQAYRDWIKQLGLSRSALTTIEQLKEDVLVQDFPEVFQPQPNNLPYPSIGEMFKGRDQFLTNLRQSSMRTKEGKATAVIQSKAVHGLGGVGKTRLAVEYAWQHASDYNALLFVGADSPENLHRNLAALVEPLVLNLPENELPQEKARIAAALRWLQSHPGWLLILDSVDTSEAASAVEDVLPRLQHGHVLITSRFTNWSAAVEPLELNILGREASIEFLLARTVGRRRVPTTDQADVTTLAEDLDGLALALEQCGAYISQRRCTFADYVAEWRSHNAKVQEWFDARLMKYPRSVAATWDTTLAQLGAGEIALLRLISWFAPDPIPMFVFDNDDAVQTWREAAAFLAKESGVPLNPTETLHAAFANLANFSMVKLDSDTVLVHRVVQEILRNRTPAAQQNAWFYSASKLLVFADLGDASDVRNWSQWNPIQPHVEMIMRTADAKGMAEVASSLMNNLSALLSAKALFAEAEPLRRRSLALHLKTFGPQHPEVAICMNNLARLLHETNRLEEAETLMRQALAIDESCFGVEHPAVARDLNNLAPMLQQTNRALEAEQLFRRAVTINQKHSATESLQLASSLSNLASLLADTDRVMEAEPLLRRALALDEVNFGPNHPCVAIRLSNLAQLVVRERDSTEAERLLKRSLQILEKSYGAEHPNVAIVLNNLGCLVQAEGRLTEAEQLMRRGLAIDEKTFGPDHPNVAARLNNLATMFCDAQRWVDAEPLMRQALTIWVRSYGVHNPAVGNAAQNYHVLLQNMGLHPDKAATLTQEVIQSAVVC